MLKSIGKGGQNSCLTTEYEIRKEVYYHKTKLLNIVMQNKSGGLIIMPQVKKLEFTDQDKKKLIAMLKKHRNCLKEELHEIGVRISRSITETETVIRNNHLADCSIQTESHVTDHQIGNLRKRIRKINEAIKRVHSNEYGYCIDCGKPIPIARLELEPSAEKCTPCKAATEDRCKIFKHGCAIRTDKIYRNPAYA